MKYRGVIFDVDGTLVDSNDAHAQAWAEALAGSGHEVSVERIRPLIGMGGDKLLPQAAGIDAHSDEGQAIGAARATIFSEKYLRRIEAFAGARQLLHALKDRGFHLAVASSAQREELDPLLRIAGAHDVLEATTSGDDADSSKPDPDIIRVALRRLLCAPGEALMIGDTPYDVEAAQRAGVDCVAFRSGGWDEADLKGALACYAGPWDLLRHLDDSPLAQALVKS